MSAACTVARATALRCFDQINAVTTNSEPLIPDMKTALVTGVTKELGTKSHGAGSRISRFCRRAHRERAKEQPVLRRMRVATIPLDVPVR